MYKRQIYDTGEYPENRGYLKYDDEGVPTRRAYLVKDGILVGRLHSRETAGIMGEPITGNARALNYTFPPIAVSYTHLKEHCKLRNEL